MRIEGQKALIKRGGDDAIEISLKAFLDGCAEATFLYDDLPSTWGGFFGNSTVGILQEGERRIKKVKLLDFFAKPVELTLTNAGAEDMGLIALRVSL